MTTTAIARGVVSGVSFRPAASDTLVFAVARSESYRASVNLYTAAPDGSAMRALTTDGHSLNPQWGAKGIAFDRERFVNLGTGQAPIADVWLRTNSGRLRRLTHLTIQQHGEGLIFGLVPIEFDAAGTRLLTALTGQDTDFAWTIDLTNGRLHRITPNGTPGVVEPSAISGDGRSLLVTEGDYSDPITSSPRFRSTAGMGRALPLGERPAGISSRTLTVRRARMLRRGADGLCDRCEATPMDRIAVVGSDGPAR